MSDFFSPNWFTEQCDHTGTAISLRIKHKIVEKQSRFQKIAIYETTDFGYLMVIDGCTMLSTRDNFLYHEMMAHPALFTHEQPKNVAIIGGGDCGVLNQVLKHDSIESVHQVDIDALVTEMAQRYFPQLCESNQDPRAHFEYADGIHFMQTAKPASLDVIIVDSTDPIGPSEGLFNHAFYRNCLDALRPGGILVQQSQSPILHQTLIKEMRDAMRLAGFDDLQSFLFPQPIYPSGMWSCTLARKAEPFGTFRQTDANLLSEQLEYYNPAIHLAGMQLPNFLKRALAL